MLVVIQSSFCFIFPPLSIFFVLFFPVPYSRSFLSRSSILSLAPLLSCPSPPPSSATPPLPSPQPAHLISDPTAHLPSLLSQMMVFENIFPLGCTLNPWHKPFFEKKMKLSLTVPGLRKIINSIPKTHNRGSYSGSRPLLLPLQGSRSKIASLDLVSRLHLAPAISNRYYSC